MAASSSHVEINLPEIYKLVLPSVIELESMFSGPDIEEGPLRRTGAGVFVDGNLILTSANLVGRVFNDEAFIHTKYYMANTAAVTIGGGRRLKTTPLAVSFSHDVAVLKVVDEEGSSSFHCSNIAKSLPTKDDFLMAVVHMGGGVGFEMMPGYVRSVGEKSLKVKAPWPLENKSASGWMEFDIAQFNGGYPRQQPISLSSSAEEEIMIGSMSSLINGSPLFNSDGDLIGVGSWDVRGSPFPVTFGASLIPIMLLLGYANTKKPADPTVIDSGMLHYHIIIKEFESCRRSSRIREITELSSSSDVSVSDHIIHIPFVFASENDCKDEIKEFEEKKVQLCEDQKHVEEEVNSLRNTMLAKLTLILAMMTGGVSLLNVFHTPVWIAASYVTVLMVILIGGFLCVIPSQLNRLQRVHIKGKEMSKRRDILQNYADRLDKQIKEVFRNKMTENVLHDIVTLNLTRETLTSYKKDVTWDITITPLFFFLYMCCMIAWAISIIQTSGEHASSPSPSPI